MSLAFLYIAPSPVSADTGPLVTTSSITGLVFYVIMAIALWKVFTKAGLPGVLGIIPIVNVVYLLRIAGMSGWLALLYLIPVVNLVLGIIVAFKLGERFGKGGGFSFFLLWLFAFVGYLILGFGSATYTKPPAIRT